MTKADKKLKALVETLKSDLDDNRETMKQFAQEIIENPARAFEWGSGKIKIAGEIDVLSETLPWLTEKINGKDKPAEQRLDWLLGHAQRKALDGAESPRESTSQISVLISNSVTAAWARLARQLSHMDWSE